MRRHSEGSSRRGSGEAGRFGTLPRNGSQHYLRANCQLDSFKKPLSQVNKSFSVGVAASETCNKIILSLWKASSPNTKAFTDNSQMVGRSYPTSNKFRFKIPVRIISSERFCYAANNKFNHNFTIPPPHQYSSTHNDEPFHDTITEKFNFWSDAKKNSKSQDSIGTQTAPVRSNYNRNL